MDLKALHGGHSMLWLAVNTSSGRGVVRQTPLFGGAYRGFGGSRGFF